MTKGRLKLWIRASRPFTLTGSVIPVILGGILPLQESKFHFGYFILSVIGITILQASVNMLNDHDDFVNNVDTKGSYGSSGVVLEGLLSPKEVYKGGILLLLLGGLIGLFLTYQRGIKLLILVLIGAISVYSYTGRPLKLKYRGFGAPVVFFIFGPLMVLGSYYVQMQEVNLNAFLASIPLGLLTTAILHANDIRDLDQDRKAGIKTLSIFVGRNSANIIYSCLILIAYISMLIMVFYKVIPYWSLISLATLPLAFKNINILNKSSGEISSIITLDQETAKLQGKFGVLFIIAILLSFF